MMSELMTSANGRQRRAVGARTHRRHFAVLLTAVVLVAAACGGGDEDAGPTTTQRSTTTTVAVLDEAQLRSALLTLADLPPGWTAETTTTSTPGDSSGDGLSEALCPAAKEAFSDDQHESAMASFTQGESGPSFLQMIGAAEDAGKHFDELNGAFSACAGTRWTVDQGGEPFEFTMAEVSAPSVGDRSAAYRLTSTATTAPVTVVMDFVLVEQGATVTVFGSMNLQGAGVTANQLTPEQFATIVTTGVDKLEQQTTTG